jgi:hypothetical protein
MLMPSTKLRLLPHLYSIDQLPRNHCETYALLERHAMAVLKDSSYPVETEHAQTVPFLADIRYVLGVLVAPADAPIFQWQALEAPYDCATAKVMPCSRGRNRLPRHQTPAAWMWH